MNLQTQNTNFVTRFKNNRKGYYSLWIFFSILLVSIFAELIANDQPIIIITQKKIYFPIFQDYTEIDFGGELSTKINYKEKYAQDLMKEQEATIIWPLIKFSYNTIQHNLGVPVPSPPSFTHWLGTDDNGRDVMAWIIYSLRISIFFSIFMAFFTIIIAMIIGTIQGYFGGLIDLLIQRIVEIWHSLPITFLLIILASITMPNFWWLLLIFLLFNWIYLSQLIRAETLKIRKLDYIKAAKALGASHIRIITYYIIPNAITSVITFFPFLMSNAIITLTSLDFLGLGLSQESPSLGTLLAQTKGNLHAPWLGISSFSIIMTILLLLLFIGEALRDTLIINK